MNNFHKSLAICALLAGSSFGLTAQNVGIGTNNPDNSAKLHIVDANRGILIPQVSIGDINLPAPVTTPATGLLVWNTNATTTNGGGVGFYYWSGTLWTRLATNSGTDNQNLTSATLAGSNLTINIEDGASTTVNLAALVNDADFVIGNEYNTGANLTGTNLNIIDGGGTRTVNLNSLINDADFVIGNEYNTGANLTGTNLNIIDGGGTRTVNLNSLINDADFVIGNEYNTGANLTGTNLNIIDGGGTRTVNLNSLINDADFVIGNEYNTGASLTGTNLNIIDGGGTRTVNLNSLINDADFVIGNEYNTGASLTGTNLNIIDGGGTRTVNLNSLINDADFVIGNEYNTGANLTGTNLNIIDGGGTRTVNLASLRRNAENGLFVNGANNAIRLGGPLIQNTTITQGGFGMVYNLNGTGDFHIQDNGVNHFSVVDNGDAYFGSDVYWRDGNTGGTILAQMIDDGDDGRFIIRENGNISVDLDANTQFVFNEQGFDRDFRVESDIDPNVFRVNAGTNRVGVGDANPAARLEVTAADGQTLMLSRQDGGITVNEQLGGIGFDGSDGNTPTDIRESSASIIAFASEDHSTGDKGGRLTFWTSPTNQDDNTDGFERLRIDQDGTHYVGGDMYWRDAAITGTNIARIVDDGNDGQMIIYEDGITQILLDANGTSVFNERGLDRNFRVESDADANNFFVDGGTNRVGIGTGAPAQKLHVVGVTRISTLAGGGNRMVIANANGDLATQAIPAGGDITAVNAGAGLTGGGTVGNVTVSAAANNGLYINAAADRIRLGGNLVEPTTITQNTFPMRFNLNGTGDFDIQDNGVNKFSVIDNGTSLFGGDVYFRDNSTLGTNLVVIEDDANDGRLRVMENGIVSVDLDANSQFIFNEQGLDRNLRVESDANVNMLFVDAGLNRVSVGTGLSAGTFNVLGTSYHSDDIYLRDGAVNGGDILVRIFDSADDGIIDVYEDNVLNHRIHGNGTTVFNEQGNNNADIRMESDTRTNMFWLDANENLVRFGTNSAFSDSGNGTTVGTVVVDYVVDFDRGIGATGTAIGIGSVEYLLDLSSETAINNRFSPTRDNVYDLGSATLRWDDVYATNGTIVTSDEREKMSIQPMNYGLSEIMKLRPVTYKWKRDMIGSTLLTDNDKELKLGLIAQEVQQILPEVVQTHDWKVMSEEQPDVYTREPMDRLGMSYHELTPVLIKAIQEQQVQIEALKEEIKALKK